MTKESLIKDLLVLGNLYNTNEEIQNAVYERALSIFNLYESEVKNLDIQRVSNCYDRVDMEYAYNADKDWQPFDKFIEEYDAPI